MRGPSGLCFKQNKTMNSYSDNIPENIAAKFEDLDGRANRTAIFKHYRQEDQSHYWPILSEFNGTERAIRRLYRWEKESGYYLTGLELCLWLDNELSNIVNNY